MATPGLGQEGLSTNLTPSKPSGHRYSSFDTGLFSNYNRENISPSTAAKEDLEAHIADTDQKIKDTSRLGTTLLEQRKVLGDRLKDLDEDKERAEVAPELQQKLADLEKEYEEVDRETNRVLVQQSRSVIQDFGEHAATPSVINGDGSNSPTKMQGPSRKQRNQPSGRVHDIEFATEISTSLLGQVRNLQNLLAEKEEALKKATKDSEELQTESKAFHQRLRSLDDNEQKYKDENWNLETQVQDLTTQLRELQDRETRLNQAISSTKLEKSTTEKEFDDLKQAHNRLNDDHAYLQKQHDLELTSLKRDVSTADEERELLQKRIDELTSQNTELAGAMAYRYQSDNNTSGQDDTVAEGVTEEGLDTPEHSPPPSPTKGTPRHGGLESETLKSSLHHAHRMIQNLKNNIHREKTDKVELKRMLQEARDEVEARRADGSANLGASGKRRKPNGQQDNFKKPARPDKLGGAKGATEEIWEDYEGSPSRRDTTRSGKAPGAYPDTSDAFESSNEHQSAQDTSDSFDTANERDTNTETDAFHTGAESLAGDSSDELTETEQSAASRSGTRPRATLNRTSFLSTASDEEDNYNLTTPPRQMKYKLKVNRGGYSRASETPSASGSPASILSNQSQPAANQNLAAELEDFGESSSIATSTPSRSIGSLQASPEFTRDRDITPIAPKPVMVDSGTSTDPWEPSSSEEDKKSDAVGIAGAASAGAVSGALGTKIVEAIWGSGKDDSKTEELKEASLEDKKDIEEVQSEPEPEPEPLQLTMSTIAALETKPVEPQQVPVEAPRAVAEELPVADEETLAKRLLADLQNQSPNVPATTLALAKRLANKSTATEEATSAPTGEKNNNSSSLVGAAAAAVGLGSIPVIGSALAGGKPPNQQKEISSDPATNTSWIQDDVKPKDREFSVLSTEETEGAISEPTLDSNSLYNEGSRQPFKSISGNASTSLLPSNERKVVKIEDPDALTSSYKLTTDEGTQTTVSSEQIEHLIKERNRRLSAAAGTASGPSKATISKSPKPEAAPLIPAMSPKRPSSSGSVRKSTSLPPVPPLPADHKELIAAASRSPGTSSPLNVPGSGQKPLSSQQIRPRTPNNNIPSTPTKSQPPSMRAIRTSSLAGSRRSSVSSFASELDERFNIDTSNRQGLLDGYELNSADPRMIQAITQTMIGEFMWKYTRKAGRGDLSTNRHKRFFWIHPYTRTLYWSDQDPSGGGRNEIKAKSVGIEGVRVVSDENPMPPGLHQKSIVVVTPGRSIKFTAATSNRHETWFNALSYLLLRGNPEVREEPTLRRDRGSTFGSMRTVEPGVDPSTGAAISNRPSSRLSQRGSVSGNRSSAALPSNVHRASSPLGSRSGSMTRAQQKMPAGAVSPSKAPSTGTSTPRNLPIGTVSIEDREKPEVFKKPLRPASYSQQKNTSASTSSRTSTGGRMSSLSSMLRPNSGMFGSSSKRGREIEQSDAGDSARPSIASSTSRLRDSVSGSRERDEYTMENVRACCDGKHDISTLAAHGGHHHHHHRHSRSTSLNRQGSTTSRVSGTWSRLGIGTGSARNSTQNLPADPANYA